MTAPAPPTPPAIGLPPLVLFEDEHLLVVAKPAGLSTHAPSPYHGEGLYEWLRHREPRWAALGIQQRLDKSTSGVMVFAKTALANRSLYEQFSKRQVEKTYVLRSERPPPRREFTASSSIERAGNVYVSKPARRGTALASTSFRLLSADRGGALIEARPLTGRTHQIRVHARDHGFPILGDRAYGGAPWPRLCLHSRALEIRHPASRGPVRFEAPEDFEADPALALRAAIIDEAETDVCRWVHGAADGRPGCYVDRLEDYLLVHAETEPAPSLEKQLGVWLDRFALRGAYFKRLNRHVRRAAPGESSPRRVLGGEAPPAFAARENGLAFELRLSEGYSFGLFLDQRDNRRRLLKRHAAAGFPLFEGAGAASEVLNAFSYTCGFSVAAAKAGARAVSLDLSRKYLDWGKRNFALNGLDPGEHEFIDGEVFDWLRRFARKGRRFDLIILDPPTFSTSKRRRFQIKKDLGELVEKAAALLRHGGVLLASANAASLEPARFVGIVEGAIGGAGRSVLRRHYAPQCPDFPVSAEEPAHLKTLWLQLE